MTLQFSPFVPAWLLGLAALVAVALTGLFYARLRQLLPRRTWRWLLALKLLGLGALFLLVANPALVERQPDPAAFQLVALVDATGSMMTRDGDGGVSRLAQLQQQALGESPFRQGLRRRFPNTAWYLFAGDELHRFDGQADFAALPGDSDLDAALLRILASSNDHLRLGAVLLLSDGLDNRGRSLVEAGPAFKQAGIPVHCIGVGDSEPRRDLAIAWTRVPAKPIKGRPMQLTAEVSRNFAGELPVRVEWYEGVRLIGERTVNFAADQRRQEVTLDHTSFTAGMKSAKVRVVPLPAEENEVNNVDYAALPVGEPEQFTVLYFSDALDWEYKFLNQLSTGQEQFRLDAIVRLGESTWYTMGFGTEGEAPRGFPASEVLNRYDALILNLHSLPLLSSDHLEALVNFTTQRGGGLILTGLTDELPERLVPLLPVKALAPAIAQAKPGPLTVRPTPLMAAWSPREAADLAALLTVPDGMPWLTVTNDQLKPGAVAVVTADSGNQVLVATQQYGAGKVALVNVSETWRWAMREERGPELHARFWARLTAWAASSLQQRLTIKPAGAKLDLASEQRVTVDVLDRYYRPESRARLTAVCRVPGGGEERVEFVPDPRVDGRYVSRFVPRATGEHRWSFRVELPDGEVLEEQVDQVVVDASPEHLPAPLAEERLRSLARITGGQYYHVRDLGELTDLPITRQIRYLETPHPWLHSWLFLLAIVLAVLPDWIARRRTGLR